MPAAGREAGERGEPAVHLAEGEASGVYGAKCFASPPREVRRGDEAKHFA